MEKKALLVLSNGTIFHAKGIGATGIKSGELVFNTSMTGYQEALTDPSYAGQILLMTYPLIGNYGFNEQWCESSKVQVQGFCVRKAELTPHHTKNMTNLDKYLEDNKVGGITNIDTRSIVRKIRDYGVMPAVLQVYERAEPDTKELVEMAKELNYSSINYVQKVSTKEIYSVGKGSKKVALIDYGVKGNIIRELTKRNCEVIVFPQNTTADDIKSHNIDAILLANGPGDPAIMTDAVEQIKKLLDYPIMGICLGHQLLATATGAKTYKLKFGHRGSNHPVLDIDTKRVYITTQNHGFAVDDKTINSDWQITHINLNDNTVEGIEHKEKPLFSIQYHPEAHPGPRDSLYLFDKFVDMIK